MTTPAETAQKMVEMMRDAGMVASAAIGPLDRGLTRVLAGTCERDEEVVFEIDATRPEHVRCCALRLGIYGKALRVRTMHHTEAGIRSRCEEIASSFREYVKRRAAQEKAWAVVDTLKALGITCIARAGRVSIELDLSPEYAAEVGPKIAAVMSGKDNA